MDKELKARLALASSLDEAKEILRDCEGTDGKCVRCQHYDPNYDYGPQFCIHMDRLGRSGQLFCANGRIIPTNI